MSKWEFSTPFRTYASTQPSLYVARDLESHYSPYVVIRRDVADQKFLWYVREVNEEFLLVLKLGGQKDILNVLGLHEYQAERNVIQSDGPILNFLQQGTTGRVVVDSRNNARFLSVEKRSYDRATVSRLKGTSFLHLLKMCCMLSFFCLRFTKWTKTI